MAPDSSPSAIVVESPNFIRILSTSKGDTEAFQAQASASAMISAEFGGTISNGTVTLEFPPNALDQDTEISIDMLGDGTLGVELSPHGTQFKKDVKVSINLEYLRVGQSLAASAQMTEPNEEGLVPVGFISAVYYMQQDGLTITTIEEIPVFIEDGQTLVFFTDHFSGYALAA